MGILSNTLVANKEIQSESLRKTAVIIGQEDSAYF